MAEKIVANLADNIQNSLPNCNIRELYGRSDSKVFLHWLRGNGSYKQFVLNSKTPVSWR